MRKSFRGFLAVVILVSVTAVGRAQSGPEGRYRPEAVAAIIDHVHQDLNRGYAVWQLGEGDRDRLTHAERQLRDFANHWQHGKFDKSNLEGAVADIQKVIDENHLSGRERDALGNDIQELRRLREAYERHEIGNS
jgi:hypothetical protein